MWQQLEQSDTVDTVHRSDMAAAVVEDTLQLEEDTATVPVNTAAGNLQVFPVPCQVC